MVELGNCYYFGCDVVKNYKTSFLLYLMATNGGSIVGMYKVDFSYTNGQGVLHSKKKVIYRYEQASNDGHDAAKKAFDRLKEESVV